MTSDFERQLAEGFALPFSGWDFSPIASRRRSASLPWDYVALLREKIAVSRGMLDLGTGGGELLASLAPLPTPTFATEGYPPNVTIAESRLAPLGVKVIPIGPDLHIDLPAGSVDLVADRHEAFSGSEIHRVLHPGGWFVTQQVGSRNNLELEAIFPGPPFHPTNDVTSAASLANEIARAGFEIVKQAEATSFDEFFDVGAVIFYLRAIPWEVPGLSLARDRGRLRKIYEGIQQAGAFRLTNHRLLVIARRSP
jgi:SAM-dependent methyltransferase